VKLLDFGVAQVADRQGESRTDLVKGKAGYFAPEQILGQPLDARVDVFALGVCLYEMLTGTRLYRREDLATGLQAILQEPVPSARRVNPNVPEQLDWIVEKALAKEPQARFQSAGEMQAALESYLAHNREVVSNRTVARLMTALFPEGGARGPTLDTGQEVLERLAPITLLPEGSPQGAGSRARSRLAHSGAAFVILVLAVFAAWFLGTQQAAPHAHDAGTAAATREPAASIPGTLEEPQRLSPEPQEAVKREEAVKRDTPEESPTDSPGNRHSKATPVAPRRASPGFLADPGF
jgi:serine/threonine-protein kinase